jgi:predicted 3-demethylubiquinone-9 3-methyltransferase (glyoxalase superfamily)
VHRCNYSYKNNTKKLLQCININNMSKLITCIWFANNDGVEAAYYYIDTFNSAPGDHRAKIGDITKSPKASEEVSGRPAGSVLTVEYELDGINFMLLNGGPVDQFKLNGATSYIVECETQAEIDFFWEKLSAVPEAEQCGWCTDKFGVTWQIVPRILDEMMRDPQKAEAVTAAFMPMKKIDLDTIKKVGEQS